MFHLYFRRGSDNCRICSRNCNEAENNKTSVQWEKMRVMSIYWKIFHSNTVIVFLKKEFALQIRLYKNINISAVEERLCYHNFFTLAEKKEQNTNCRQCAGVSVLWLSAFSELSNYTLSDRCIIIMALGGHSIWCYFCFQHGINQTAFSHCIKNHTQDLPPSLFR